MTADHSHTDDPVIASPGVSGVSDTDALAQALASVDTLTIACHRDPDPDAIASALGLKCIATELDVPNVRIVYGGSLSHQENRAMVNLLDIELEKPDDETVFAESAVALVDHSTPERNSPVPTEITPRVVLDHHPVENPRGHYIEQSPELGATATIVATHLRSLPIRLDRRVATALYFALHTETRKFTRGTTAAEHEVASMLLQAVDFTTVRQLNQTQFSVETLDGINTAITNREVRGSCLVASADRCSERDVLPQAADYLLKLEGITTTVVYGLVEDSIQLSARTTNPLLDLGDVLADAFDEVGSAGGHDHMAGGEIPLGLFGDQAVAPEKQLELVDNAIRGRVFDALGRWTDDQ